MSQCATGNINLKVEDLIVIKYQAIKEGVVTVEIPELNGVKGTVNVRELANRKVKKPAQVAKKGKLEVAQVLRIDYVVTNPSMISNVELSVRVVDDEQRELVMERHTRNNTAYSIADKACRIFGFNIKDMYRRFLNYMGNMFGSQFDYLAKIKLENDKLTGSGKLDSIYDLINLQIQPYSRLLK